MIIIKFKSDVDFSNSEEFIPMTQYQVFKIDGRLVRDFLPSLDIFDVWDGKNIIVQQTFWKYWFFDVNMNESQMEMLSVIMACNDIIIQDTAYNIEATLDTSNSEYNLVEKSELLSQTSNYRVIARFRSSPKVVNRYKAVTNVNYIKVGANFYYTENTVIPNIPDSTLQFNESNKGLEEVSTSDFKSTLQFVFYLNGVGKNTFKKDFETTLASSITCFNGTIFTLLENSIVTVDQLGEDFYKVEAPCVIDGDRIYF